MRHGMIHEDSNNACVATRQHSQAMHDLMHMLHHHYRQCHVVLQRYVPAMLVLSSVVRTACTVNRVSLSSGTNTSVTIHAMNAVSKVLSRVVERFMRSAGKETEQHIHIGMFACVELIHRDPSIASHVVSCEASMAMGRTHDRDDTQTHRHTYRHTHACHASESVLLTQRTSHHCSTHSTAHSTHTIRNKQTQLILCHV